MHCCWMRHNHVAKHMRLFVADVDIIAVHVYVNRHCNTSGDFSCQLLTDDSIWQQIESGLSCDLVSAMHCCMFLMPQHQGSS